MTEDFKADYYRPKTRRNTEEDEAHHAAKAEAVKAVLSNHDKFKTVPKRFRQLTYNTSAEDPTDVVMNAIGPTFNAFRDIYGPRVLVATAPSAVTQGFLIAGSSEEEMRNEARWQGKAGLVIATGPEAFEYNPRYPQYKWEGPKPQVGDWVFFKTADAHEIGVRYELDGQTYYASCRVIWDNAIIASIDSPEIVL